MHLQFANWERLKTKHALYKVWEVVRFTKRTIENIEATYNQALDETGIRTTPTPASWWEPYQKWMGHVDFKSEPWQAAECKRLYAEHGPEKFKGLNLFGVAP
jgi:hypothetical protein